MVKANAYGHGDIQVAKTLFKLGCEFFGVGLVEEGLHLRASGLIAPQILVFGFSGKEAVREMLNAQLTPVVSDWEQMDLLVSQLKQNGSLSQNIHIKINTGMNRLGFSRLDMEKLVTTLKEHSFLKVVGCGTHLMTGEDLNSSHASAYKQLRCFADLLKKLSFPSCTLHAYNTAGAIHMHQQAPIAREFPFGLRIGLGMYGYATVPMDQSRKLYPGMSFLSRIVSVQNVNKNECVSYGGTWVAKKNSRIGIVPAGYADGVPTQLSNKGVVMVGGIEAPIVGRVCMDYTLIDVTDIENILDRDVEFFGTQISAEKVAERAGTITYDILTRVSERVPRVYI